MDVYVVILRNLHIFGGIIWVGFALFTMILLVPAVKNMGTSGHTMMKGFLNNSRFAMALPAASVITTVAGLLLYYEVSDGFNADYMGSTQGIVLSIGVLAGLLAFGHGGAAMGKVTNTYVAALEKDGPESATVAAAFDKLTLHGYISTGLTVIAVIGMATARYAG